MCYSEWFRKSVEADELEKRRKTTAKITERTPQTAPAEKPKAQPIPEKQPAEEEAVPV